MENKKDTIIPDYFYQGGEKVVLNIRKCLFCKRRYLISKFFIDCKYRRFCRKCYKEALMIHIERNY